MHADERTDDIHVNVPKKIENRLHHEFYNELKELEILKLKCVSYTKLKRGKINYAPPVICFT